MANTISGKVIAVSAVQNVTSKNGKQTQQQQLFLDCTRYDPYTGERSEYENTPLLDFRGENIKLLEGVQKGDVVTITFDVNGYKYEKDGKTQVFTSIRPYQLVKRTKQQATKQAAQTTVSESDDLPF